MAKVWEKRRCFFELIFCFLDEFVRRRRRGVIVVYLTFILDDDDAAAFPDKVVWLGRRRRPYAGADEGGDNEAESQYVHHLWELRRKRSESERTNGREDGYEILTRGCRGEDGGLHVLDG